MPYELVEDEESLGGTLGRGLARSAARVGEAVVGGPGDIVAGVAGLGNLASQALGGGQIDLLSSAQNNPFTSRSIKENVTEGLTGDYLKPRGSGEEFIDTIIGDIASLIAPGGLATSGSRAALKGLATGGLKAAGKTIGKQALRAGAANVAGGLAEEYTGSPLLGGAVKMGTLIASGTIGGRKQLKEIQKQNYDQALESIPDRATIPAHELKGKLKHGIRLVENSDIPDKKFILERLNAVDNSVQGGRIGAKEAVELRKNLNNWIYNQNITGESKRYTVKLRDLLNERLDEYGTKNKQFGQLFDAADDITRGLKAGGAVQKFLNENVTVEKFLKNWKPLSYAGGNILYFLGKPGAGAALGATGAAAGAKYLGQTYNLLKTSSVARQHYKELITASLKQSPSTFAKALQKFDQVASKTEGKQGQARYELVG